LYTSILLPYKDLDKIEIYILALHILMEIMRGK